MINYEINIIANKLTFEIVGSVTLNSVETNDELDRFELRSIAMIYKKNELALRLKKVERFILQHSQGLAKDYIKENHETWLNLLNDYPTKEGIKF